MHQNVASPKTKFQKFLGRGQRPPKSYPCDEEIPSSHSKSIWVCPPLRNPIRYCDLHITMVRFRNGKAGQLPRGLRSTVWELHM